jgi:hypothetical protein
MIMIEAKKPAADFWQAVPMEPILLLARLREAVLRRTEGKRCPKWAFRLAPDLAVQLQPRPTILVTRPGDPQRVIEFLGVALLAVTGEVPRTAFKGNPRNLAGDWLRVMFTLYANAGDVGWMFKLSGYGWSRSMRGRNDVVQEFRARVIEALPAGLASLRPELMLSPNCLCCGKALTDPASMARWIGPECDRNGSLMVPGMDRDRMAEQLFVEV